MIIANPEVSSKNKNTQKQGLNKTKQKTLELLVHKKGNHFWLEKTFFSLNSIYKVGCLIFSNR